MQDFIQFVTSQPQDKKIIHVNWHSCAIGDYARSISQAPTDELDHIERLIPRCWGEQMKICIDSLKELYIPNTYEELTMYDVLGEGYIDPNEHSGHTVETYGGLQNLITWCINEQ